MQGFPTTKDILVHRVFGAHLAADLHERKMKRKAQGTCLRSHRESRPLTRKESPSLNSGVQFSALLGSDSSIIWKKSQICWGKMCLCSLYYLINANDNSPGDVKEKAIRISHCPGCTFEGKFAEEWAILLGPRELRRGNSCSLFHCRSPTQQTILSRTQSTNILTC